MDKKGSAANINPTVQDIAVKGRSQVLRRGR